MPLPEPEAKSTAKTPEQIQAEAVAKRAAAADAQKKKAVESQKKRAEQAQAGMDDVALDVDDDPAGLEHRAEQADKPATTTATTTATTSRKPPVE